MNLKIELGPRVTLRTSDSNLSRVMANTDCVAIERLLNGRIEGFDRLEARVDGVDYRIHVG